MLRMRLMETNATMISRTMIRPKLKARRVLILSLDIGYSSSAESGKRALGIVLADRWRPSVTMLMRSVCVTES
ncbi:hypothetical protein D3C81_1647970 [compost metagenome]